APTYKSIVVPGRQAFCDAHTDCLRKMGPLVSAHSVRQYTGLSEPLFRETFRYQYTDGRNSLDGDGWLGFSNRLIEKYDGSSTLIERTSIDYDNKSLQTAGRVLKASTTKAPLGGDTTPQLTETVNNWRVDTSGRNLPFVFRESTTTTVSETT